MNKLKNWIYDENNDLDYALVGDYFIPDLKAPEEHRPISRWGRFHKLYLEETNPAIYQNMVLDGTLWTMLADLNEQVESRLETIITQMNEAEGVTEELKVSQQLVWAQRMNSIRNRAEEIVLTEMIYQ